MLVITELKKESHEAEDDAGEEGKYRVCAENYVVDSESFADDYVRRVTNEEHHARRVRGGKFGNEPRHRVEL